MLTQEVLMFLHDQVCFFSGMRERGARLIKFSLLPQNTWKVTICPEKGIKSAVLRTVSKAIKAYLDEVHDLFKEARYDDSTRG